MSKDDQELAMSLSHQESNDDDWELFVPVNGDVYPAGYQVKLHSDTPWQEGRSPGKNVLFATCHAYRKPKQKENKMPERTPQQALKDAIDSGAVEAWINGEDIQYRVYHPKGSEDIWVNVDTRYPDFSMVSAEYRPKPPEPTKINWRSVVTGKEPQGLVLGVWYGTVATCTYAPKDGWRLSNDGSVSAAPKFYAPMCNLPEGDK